MTKLRHIEEVSHREGDISLDSGTSSILSRDGDHSRINISGVDCIASWGVDFFLCLFPHLLKEFCIMKWEFLDTKWPKESWCDISREHRCFYEDRPGSTEWVEEGSTVLPVRKCDEGCPEIFLQRSFSGISAISTLMQRIARHIQEDMGDIIDNEDEDMHLRLTRVVRSHERGKYCVLSDTLDRRDTRECWTSGWCLDDDTFSTGEIRWPVEWTQEIVERIEINYFLFGKGEIDSIGETWPDEEFIEILSSSTTLHEPIECTDITHSDFLTFSLHERLESWLTGEEKLEWWKVGILECWIVGILGGLRIRTRTDFYWSRYDGSIWIVFSHEFDDFGHEGSVVKKEKRAKYIMKWKLRLTKNWNKILSWLKTKNHISMDRLKISFYKTIIRLYWTESVPLQIVLLMLSSELTRMKAYTYSVLQKELLRYQSHWKSWYVKILSDKINRLEWMASSYPKIQRPLENYKNDFWSFKASPFTQKDLQIILERWEKLKINEPKGPEYMADEYNAFIWFVKEHLRWIYTRRTGYFIAWINKIIWALNHQLEAQKWISSVEIKVLDNEKSIDVIPRMDDGWGAKLDKISARVTSLLDWWIAFTEWEKNGLDRQLAELERKYSHLAQRIWAIRASINWLSVQSDSVIMRWQTLEQWWGIAVTDMSADPEANKVYIEYLGSFLNSVRTVSSSPRNTAAQRGSRWDWSARQDALSPLLRWLMSLLGWQKIDPKNFSWSEVVNKFDFDSDKRYWIQLRNICIQSTTTGDFATKIQEIPVLLWAFSENEGLLINVLVCQINNFLWQGWLQDLE